MMSTEKEKNRGNGSASKPICFRFHSMVTSYAGEIKRVILLFEYKITVYPSYPSHYPGKRTFLRSSCSAIASARLAQASEALAMTLAVPVLSPVPQVPQCALAEALDLPRSQALAHLKTYFSNVPGFLNSPRSPHSYPTATSLQIR